MLFAVNVDRRNAFQIRQREIVAYRVLHLTTFAVSKDLAMLMVIFNKPKKASRQRGDTMDQIDYSKINCSVLVFG